jgi:hypothetical protein
MRLGQAILAGWYHVVLSSNPFWTRLAHSYLLIVLASLPRLLRSRILHLGGKLLTTDHVMA